MDQHFKITYGYRIILVREVLGDVMGDGRYYTNYQFMSVVIIMLITVISVVGALISYYRNKGRAGSMFICVSFTLMAVTSIMRFVENVIPNMVLAGVLRSISCFSFIMCILTMLYYFCIKSFTYLGRNLKIGWIIYSTSFLTLACVFFISLKIDVGFIITDYRFVSIEYSEVYSAIVLTVSILVLLVSVRFGVSKTRVQKGYSNGTVAMAIVLFFCLPTLFYFWTVTKENYYTNFGELLIFIAICISIGAVNYFDTPLGLSSSVFDRIADSIQNYIIITDVKKSIVYKNKSVLQSGLFCDTDYFSSLADMFEKASTTSEEIYDECIKVNNGNDTVYLTYKQSPLKNGEKTMGYIISISDITKIIELIHSIEDRSRKTQENNLKLKDYSKIVYELEKEKRINILVDEVIKRIENQLKLLAGDIKDLEGRLQDSEFETLVDGVIQTNMDILNDVKQAVTTYKQHYS